MEIKINKEIRNYTENVFFGLSLRQFIFSVIACLVAVGLYFLLKPYFAISELSWMCILGATPFAVLGFVSYNGMTAEQLIVAFIKTEILTPKKLKYRSNNYYYNMMKQTLDKKRREEMKKIEIPRQNKKER